MRLIRVLLAAPFSFIWLCITNIRNALYDMGVLKSVKFGIPVICVGNLSVGGTGKTPTINYLISFLLAAGKSVAVVSRGYGRITKGFLIADAQSTAASVGDEPLLFFKRWSGRVVVAVGEDRVRTIRLVRERHPGLEVILMDDGFQHRAVSPSALILLSSYQNPFYADYIMPSGTLRESRRWARRASLMVVTKAPDDIDEEEKSVKSRKAANYLTPDTPVYFSHIQYGEPVAFGRKADWCKRVFLVTGIANPGPLLQYLEQEGVEVVIHWAKADHFSYNDHEMGLMIEEYKKLQNCVILTTEKDYVKMAAPAFRPFLNMAPFFYIPVEFSFSKEKENFEAAITEMVNKNLDEQD